MDYDNVGIDPAKELLEDGGITLLGTFRVKIYIYICTHVYTYMLPYVYIYIYNHINTVVENYALLEGPG